MMTSVERFQEVKRLLGENGEHWCQGKYFDRLTGDRCLLGAFMKTIEGDPAGGGGEIFLLTSLVNERGFDNVARFNDAISTRWTHVEEVLDEATRRASK